MLQNATSSEFITFPSTSEDQYRSMQATVSTEVDDLPLGRFVGVEADFRIADGRNISGLYLGASGYVDGSGVLADELSAAEADLASFKAAVDEWYIETLMALKEVQAAIA